MHIRGCWALLALAMALTASAIPARADETSAAVPPMAPNAQSTAGDLLAVLRADLGPAFRSERDSDGRRESIRQLIRKRFDLERIAATTLGEFWVAAPAEQREGFRVVLADHMTKMIDRMLGNGMVEVENAGRVRDKGEFRYATLTLRTRNGLMPCVFVLSGDSGRVTDVVIYGISMVTMKQAEFRSILNRGGMPELMTALAE